MIETPTVQEKALLDALKNMMGNYLSLKRMSLILARSDSPNWMPNLDENDDIYVIAARKAIALMEKPVDTFCGKDPQ
jgi:hypothetical protein